MSTPVGMKGCRRNRADAPGHDLSDRVDIEAGYGSRSDDPGR